MSRSLTLAVAVAVTLTAPLSAQDEPIDSLRAVSARRLLSADLRNLVTSQEVFFADNMTYAASLRELASLQYQASFGVTVVLLTSSNTGHSEIAVVDKVPGLVCATFIGDAPPPMGRGGEGEVICRGP